MFSNPKIPVSLEFFPPKTAQGADKLRLVRQELYGLNPQLLLGNFWRRRLYPRGYLPNVE